MNNFGNIEINSNSSVQTLTTHATSTIASSTTSPIAPPVAALATTTETSAVIQSDKRDFFYTSNTNANLINNSDVKQENDTIYAEATTEVYGVLAAAAAAAVAVPVTVITSVIDTTTPSVAVAASMSETASVAEFTTAGSLNSTCSHELHSSHRVHDIANATKTANNVLPDKFICDKYPTTTTTTTTNTIVTTTMFFSTPTTICDNELLIEQLKATPSPTLTRHHEARPLVSNGTSTPIPIASPFPMGHQMSQTPNTVAATSLKLVEGNNDADEGDHRVGVEKSLLFTTASSSPRSIAEENLEMKTTNVTTTAAPPSLIGASRGSSISADSNSADIVTTGSKSDYGSDDSVNNKNQMLLRKKINTLTATSSEPILLKCGSGSSCSSLLNSGSTATTTSGAVISRRVSFPKGDDALVTGYLEPANPWEHVHRVTSISEVVELYTLSCHRHKTVPLPIVLDHLKTIELHKGIRQPNLILKSIKLLPSDCEALEEIFKRIQYKFIDVSSCELNETAMIALFDMFEYYEAVNELDISSDSGGLTMRAWTSCIYLIGHSRELHVLNAKGNLISKSTAENLGNALNSSNLHTIKLEHCGLRGLPLDSLCHKLRNNQILKELWLAHNDLTNTDADKIAQLLKVNHYLQFIDISNNNIRDDGLAKIVAALIEQSAELERKQKKAEADAFVEAEHRRRQQAACANANSLTSNSMNSSTNGTSTGVSTDDDTTSGDSDASPAEEDDDDDEDEDEDDDADDADVDTDANDVEDDDITTTDDGGVPKIIDDDDDDEDTVKTTTTTKTTQQPINGQSKLDKLLSMNNSDSSEDVPTDTVAASDISVSDDIFESASPMPVVTSTPIAVPVPVPLTVPVLEQTEQSVQPISNNNSTEMTIFEVCGVLEDTAADASTIVTPIKVLDVNKNMGKVDDYDDTHSTDSAFESSSDGDISRHLPDEFVCRFEMKDDVETATIATEALITPTPSPPPVLEMSTPPTTPKPIEVTSSNSLSNIMGTSASPNTSCDSSSGDMSALKNAALTGTSPSPTTGLRRTESTCTITQSTRARSHSSDSLSSENSLDGSVSDAGSGKFSTKINEKLTKNDTLTRQKQFDVPQDSNKSPQGLKALALWNNNLTKESGPLISDLLNTTVSLELLNIGKNILSNDFVAAIRDSLSQNTTLTTLGLQSAHLSCAGIRTLSSILQFGGNSTLQRIDIRDNKIEVESLNMLAEALKSNTIVTQIDIDDEPKRLSVGSDAQLDYARVLDNVRSLCSRNENQPTLAAAADKANTVCTPKPRSGYYLGSRKISLTCHTAPPRSVVDQANNTTSTSNKLEVKKKTGARLRSPIPSPPISSPSSSPVPSPSKGRFQVILVPEISPLQSPISPSSSPSPSPSPTPICTPRDITGVLINSKDSTTTIKRLSTSPRSRFHVMKIQEDPGVPIAYRTLPPITPSPSPPAISSLTTLSSSASSEEPKIVTTPATPPIEEEKNTQQQPSFTVVTRTPLPPSLASITTTDTKIDPNCLIENNSTNIVKPNDKVDASIPSPLASQHNVEEQIDESLQSQLVPKDEVVSSSLLTTSSALEEDQRTLTNSSVNSLLIDSLAITTTAIGSSAQNTAPEYNPATIQSTPFIQTPESQTKEPVQQQLDKAQETNESIESNESHESQQVPEKMMQQQSQPTVVRTRKTSWIQNSTHPGTVDRLLSIFQNRGPIFQRSSSPDTALSTARQDERAILPCDADQQSLVPVRKRSPPTQAQFSSWCKLGTEICKPVTTVIQTAAAVSSGNVTGSGAKTAVIAAPVESPLSFFDAASRQLRDFSKQVFRQNTAFGNEAASNVASIVPNQELSQQLQHDCDTIPSDMKLEIKENISPEHTINEEQLQTLQKIGGSPGSSSTGSSETDTTEGASSTTSASTTSSPSSLLSAPLIGSNSVSPPEVLGPEASTLTTVSVSQSPVSTVSTEEQSCTS